MALPARVPSRDRPALSLVHSAEESGPRAALRFVERQDAELVVLARAGDPAAFEALYRKHAAGALSLAVRVQGHALDTEDVVHDAFLRVFDRLHELREASSFRPWLFKVVVRLLRSRARRRRLMGAFGWNQEEPIDLEALADEAASPQVRAELAEVYALLRSLPFEHSLCWVLRMVEGRKLEEVAELTGSSLATVKRRIAAVSAQLSARAGSPTPEEG